MNKFYHIILATILLTCSKSSYSQIYQDEKEFIRVYSSQLCLVPPFGKIETEFSESKICRRAILPSKKELGRYYDKELYESWDQEPFYQDINPNDYDSIVDFIMFSGLLDIGLDYTKPIVRNGLVVNYSGGCYFDFIIELADSTYKFPTYVAHEIELPELLVDFNELFLRISGKYKQKD